MDNPSARSTWLKSDIPESFNAIYDGTAILSKESAWHLLSICIDNAIVDLKTIFKDFDNYEDSVRFSLINLMFNMGKPVFSQFNTFIKLVKDNDYLEASNDLAKTKWATQVPNRSKRVCALLKGDDSGYQTL